MRARHAPRPRRRRDTVAAFALVAAAFAIACGAPERRNAVLIVVDTLRWDHVGIYGDARNTTPVIDALAREGIRFERAYATAPWTKPSVASIFTGQAPREHGVNGVFEKLPDEAVTLAEVLASHGYATGGVVSHSLLLAQQGYAQGFEEYDSHEARGHDYVSTRGVTHRAIGLLERFAAGDRPFLLFVHYFDPHYNYIGHPEFGFAAPRVGRLDGTQAIAELRSMQPALTEAERGFLRDRYDEEVRLTDAGIGRLLERLAALGLDRDTIVIVTADHGEEFGERGWIGHTRTLYEELVRVPWILRIPGAGHRVIREPVSLRALAPTLLDLLDVDPGGGPLAEGSLAAPVLGTAPAAPAAVRSEVRFKMFGPVRLPKEANKRAVIGERFKLIRDEDSGVLELYDLESDPLETRNLASEQPERVRSLLSQLDAESPPAARGVTIDPTTDEIEDLRALGYVQ